MRNKFLSIGLCFPTGTFPTDIFSAQADIVSQIKGAHRWVEKKSPNIVVKLVKGLKSEFFFNAKSHVARFMGNFNHGYPSSHCFPGSKII